MKTKPKLMVCALIFVSGAILNLFFSTAVHGLLTREITRLSLLPIGDCLASLFSNRQHKYSFMLLGCFLLMYLGVLGYVVLEAFGELF